MPNKSDMLLQAPNSIDVDRPEHGVDTRFLLGYPRLERQSATDTDAEVAHNAALGIPPENLPTYVAGITIAPEPTDPIADVKRAELFRSHTGMNVITGGRVSNYLRGNFDTRVLDGAASFQVVDQTFEPIPGQAGKSKPGLSYFRLGKPEPTLLDTDGKPLPATGDRLRDQKYASGIGMFSDGSLDIWTKKAITLHSSSTINLVADGKHEVTNGDNYKATYSYVNEEDEEKVKEGHLKPQQVARKITSVAYERHGLTGHYEQKFERAQSLGFNSENKGEVAFSSKYEMGLGAKIDNSYSLEFGTSVSGKIELKKSYELEIGKHGAIFHGTAGKWITEDDHSVRAAQEIKLSVDPTADLTFNAAASRFRELAFVSGAAQLAAMTTYNGILFDWSTKPLSPASASDMEHKGADEIDNEHNLKSALDAGMKLYESCAITGMVVAAASALVAALRAKSLGMPSVNPLAPTITVTNSYIELKVNTTTLTIGAMGITSSAPIIATHAVQANVNAAQVGHQPGGPLPVVPPPPSAALLADLADMMDE